MAKLKQFIAQTYLALTGVKLYHYPHGRLDDTNSKLYSFSVAGKTISFRAKSIKLTHLSWRWWAFNPRQTNIQMAFMVVDHTLPRLIEPCDHIRL